MMIASRFWSRSLRYRREILLQQLEERIVLDAALSATQDDPANQVGNSTDPGQSSINDPTAQAEAGGTTDGDANAGLGAPQPDNFEQVFSQDPNVVIVSTDLGEVAQPLDVVLVAHGLADPDGMSALAEKDGIHIVWYDPATDNLASITSMLKDLSASTGQSIGNLAILSHGTEGVLTLGSEQLQVLSLADHEATFNELGGLMTEDGQIQFYACSLAGDSYGKDLVDLISAYTSADVFASIDSTGGGDLNWDLEYASSTDVGVNAIFSKEGMALVHSELVATLVKDIMPGTGNGIVGNPNFTSAGDYLIFTGYVNTLGYEPWVSDGTAAGTINLLDIYAGTGSSSPAEFTKVGNTVFFVATDATHGRELWMTDGTTAGTQLVKDIRPGTTASSPANLFAANGLLYFSANDGTNGTELWVSDGTEAGTYMVANLTAGSSSSIVKSFAEMGGDVYFSYGTTTANGTLWKTDGSAAGTVQVTSVPYGVNYITELNGQLFFSAQGPAAGYTNVGYELWKSDGTAAGTDLLIDIYGGGYSSSPSQLTVVGDHLYFIAYGTTYGSEVWVTDGVDGTAAHTYVIDVVAGSGTSSPNWLTESGGKAFWSARTISTGSSYYLHVHDPLVGGSPTQLTTTAVYNLADAADMLYFSTTATGYGTELWKSDGTIAGTVLAEDVNPGTASSSPNYMTYVNGTLFFSAYNSATGTELYKVVLAPPSQPPVNTVGTAGPFLEDAVGVDLGSAFSVSDPDAGDTLTVTVSSSAFSGFSVDGVNYSSTFHMVGTQGDINSALANLTGNLAPDFSGDARITITTTDQNDLSDSDTLIVPVANTPDPPSLKLPTTQRTFAEDIYYQIGLANSTSVWSVSDPDPGDILTMDFSVLPVPGFPDIAGYGSISVTGYSGTYEQTGQLVGTVSELNALLQNQLYVYVEPNFNGVAQLYVKVTDSTGNVVEDVYDAITISAVNDAPVNTVPGTQSTDEDTPIVFNQANGNLISVFDVDADPGELRVTLNATNGMVTLSGTTGLTFLSGDGTDDVSTIFTGTQANINAALDGLVFTPFNEGFDYTTADAALQIITNDQGNTGGFALQDTDTINISVSPVPDAPVNTVNPFVVAEGTTLVNLGNAVSVHDGDPDDTLFVQLSVGTGFTGLSLNGVSYVSSLMLTGTETLINSILAGLTGQIEAGFTGDATIEMVTNDIGGLQDIDTLTVTVDPSCSCIIGPVGPFVEDSGVVSLAGGISVSDPEGDPMTVTLEVTAGYDQLNIVASGAAVVTGNGTAVMTIEGSQQDINGSLATLTGTLTPDFFGAAAIAITVTDGVNTENHALLATVSGVNDAPTVNLPGPQVVDEGTLEFSTANGNAIVFGDIEAGSEEVGVRLTATNGTLTLASVAGLTMVIGDGTDDADVA
ncbi:MAG: DUF4347 domain-containing protein, partial [Desulfomonilaceae bacterium]|nr:DUF4347 domain-containing protein [Desulfomonilaceae bacterium]